MMNNFNPFQVPPRVRTYSHMASVDSDARVRQHAAIALFCVIALMAGLVLISMSRAGSARNAAQGVAPAQNEAATDPRNANVISAMAIEQGRLMRGTESPPSNAPTTAAEGNAAAMTP